jgi:hypothetical protein
LIRFDANRDAPEFDRSGNENYPSNAPMINSDRRSHRQERDFAPTAGGDANPSVSTFPEIHVADRVRNVEVVQRHALSPGPLFFVKEPSPHSYR